MANKKLKVPWQPRLDAAQNARQVLPGLAEQFFRAGRAVVNQKASLKELHQFRLQVKRFRYSLELFRPCYGPGLKQRLEALKKIQDYLGAINDCQTTLALLKNPSLRRLPEKRPFQEFLSARMAEDRANFFRYWQETLDAPGRQRWWADYLKRFAGGRNRGAQ